MRARTEFRLAATLPPQSRIEPSSFGRRDDATIDPASVGAKFIYVLGGRLRGRTLTTVERLDLCTRRFPF
jgi:hypothetical protein